MSPPPSSAGRPASRRLARRLTVLITGAIATVALLLGVLALYFDWQAVRGGFERQLKSLAVMAALPIDGDAFAHIRTPEDEHTPAYQEIAAWLQQILEAENLAYVYTVVPGPGGEPMLVVDGSAEREPVGTLYDFQQELLDMYETGAPTVTGIVEEEGYGAFMTGYAPLFDSTGALVGAVAVDRGADQIMAAVRRDGLLYLAAWLLLTLICGLIGARVAARVAARVTELAAVADELARGDLTRTLTAATAGRPDEIDDLRGSLAAMQTHLHTLVGNLQGNARQVLGTTAEVLGALDGVSKNALAASTAMDEVVAGTSEQAASVQEVAGFMEEFRTGFAALLEAVQRQETMVRQAASDAAEIAAVAGQVVTAATEAAAAAAGTTEVAQQGHEAVRETAAGVRHVSDVLRNAQGSMAGLHAQAGQIGQISATIRELAEQSNLLALNAAIEAARAGEHGRGFAVVAGQVSELAGHSGRSAAEINQILAAVQQDVAVALERMEAGLAAAEAGTGKADRALAALAEIEQSAGRTRELIHSAAESSAGSAALAQQIEAASRAAASEMQRSVAATRSVVTGAERAGGAVDSVAAISARTDRLAGDTRLIMGRTAETSQDAQRVLAQLHDASAAMDSLVRQFRTGGP